MPSPFSTLSDNVDAPENLRQRWNDPAFLASVRPAIQGIFVARAWLEPTDLRALRLGVEGEPASLEIRDNLSKVSMGQVSFDFAVLCTSLAGGVFSDVSWKHSIWVDCVLTKATFERCFFDGAKLDALMDDAVFRHCTFVECRVAAKSQMLGRGGRRLRFEHCDFSGAQLKNLTIRGGRFVECQFAGARFVQCDLKGTQFVGQRPDDGQFEKCVL